MVRYLIEREALQTDYLMEENRYRQVVYYLMVKKQLQTDGLSPDEEETVINRLPNGGKTVTNTWFVN